MADPASIEFGRAHDLAERLYELQAAQATQVLDGVHLLNTSVNELKTTVALIQSHTAGLPDRVLALENLRYKGMSIIAFAMFTFGLIQSVVMLVATKHW
jgi:uncharacterized coiled-coil protein SlyX